MNIIILISIFFILIPFLVILHYRLKKTSTDNKGCTGQGCIKTMECGVLDPSTIKKCNNDSSICQSCRCTNDTSVRLGCMECKIIDNKKTKYISDISKEKCLDPFEWDESNNTCYLKSGSYCLPHTIPDINCNPYTGDKLLVRNGNLYEWKCVCKNPYKFDGSDCSNIKICGMMDSHSNPSINGRSLVNRNDGSLWSTQSDWDPLKDGKCICNENENEYFDENTMSCLPSTCFPGTVDSSSGDIKRCKCPSGYVDCAAINFDEENNSLGLCQLGTCVPDPCKSGGKLGNSGHTCICDNANGYYNAPDANSVFGFSCQKLCPDGPENPCGYGPDARGTCFVWKGGYDNLIWEIDCANTATDFKCPDAFHVIKLASSTPMYLKNDFTLSSTFNEDFFFKFEDTNGNDAIVLNINQSYYIKDKSGKYVNFMKNETSVVKNPSFIVQLTQDQDVAYSTNQYQLYLSSVNMYISGNTDGTNKIKVQQSYKNTARCGSETDNTCNTGYVQDSNHMCNQQDPGTCQGSFRYSEAQCETDTDKCKPGFSAVSTWNGIFGGFGCSCTCIKN
jgi:hypothetical protein